MYESSNTRNFFRLVSAGLLDSGVCEVIGKFGLEQSREAWDAAAERAGFRADCCQQAVTVRGFFLT